MRLKKRLRELRNPIRRAMGLLLTLSFFTGVAALSLHHHDASFPLNSCAICKVKASLAGTLSKVKADQPLLAAAMKHGWGGISLAVSWMRHDRQTPLAEPLLFHRLSNRAPPAIS